MSDPARSPWPNDDVSPAGADSIAEELASRIAAVPSAPSDALDWAAVAASFEQEALALGATPAAAHLLFEAARIYEERLGDAVVALAFHRRALALDPGYLPNLRSCRRLAMDAGDDALAAAALEAEAAATTDPAARAELLLLRGRLLAGLGQEREAREVLARAVAAAPEGFAAAEEAARAAAARGDRPALAEAYVRCAAAAADRRLSAHFLSAASALLEEALGEPERAGALALDAFALLPEDPLLRATARRHAERLGRTDALAGILRAEAEAATGRAAARAWHALSLLEERAGRPDAAIAALERGRAAAPGDLQVLSGLARVREALGAWADASDALEALATAHLARDEAGHAQEAIHAKLRRAELEEAQLGRTHVAIDCCRDVVALDPGNRTALSALGRLCSRLGDWEGLLAAFEAEARAARDPREQAQRTFKAAEVLEERLGRVDDALARYRDALSLDPGLLPARAALERLCEAEGRWEELCRLLEGELGELRSVGEQVAHLFRVARLREDRLGDLAGAAAVYQRVLALDPASRVAAGALEALLLRLGRFEELSVQLALDAAAAEDPRRRLAILQRRAELVEEHLEDPEVARAAWEDVRLADPRHLPALRALGRLHGRAARWEELAAMFRAEADAAPDATTAADLVYRVAEIVERRLGRPEDAAELYEEVGVLAPAHGPALQALARLYRARGDDARLVSTLRAQAMSRPSSDERVVALLEAGRVCEERLGELDRAVESYEEALAVDATSAEALRALDRLYGQLGWAEQLAALRRTAGEEEPADRAERLLRLARLEADRVGDASAALRAAEQLLGAAPGHPAGLLLELRLSPDPARRARARAALAGAAEGSETQAALLAAAALELRPAAVRRETLARAAALAPASAGLVPEAERRLRQGGDDAELARFCDARAASADDLPSRASWAVRAAEAWDRAGDAERALAAFQTALAAAPASLPALRGARALFTRRGDWAAVRGTLEREAAALHDPQAAARAYVEAGDLAARRLADRGDVARAAPEQRLEAREGLRRERGALRGARALFTRRGDWAAVRGMLEREAAALHDPQAAARAYVEAGDLSARRLDDPAGAAAAYRLAAERTPLAPEPLARLEALLGRGASDVAAVREARAVAEQDAERAAEGWVAAARTALSGAGGREAALAALDRAVEARPRLPAALELRARVRADAGRHAEALADLDACLALDGEPAARVMLHLSAAGLCEDALRDEGRALSHLEAALALAPDNAEALSRRARLLARTGRIAEAAAALRRLVDVPGLPLEAHVEHLEALALAEERLGDPEAAAAALRRAVAVDPANDDAHRRLLALDERHADVTTRVASLEGAAGGARDAALRADAHVGAAGLLEGLGERERAALHLRAALELDPERTASRETLAHLLEEIDPPEALAEHRRLIARDPTRVASWTALYRHFERSRGHDRAYVTAAVLRWLGAPIPGPAAEQLLLEGDRQQLAAPPALADEDLALLRAPGDAWPLSEAIELVGDAVAAAEVAPAERGEPLRDHPLHRALADAAKAFGAPPWELHPGSAGRVDVEPATPYRVLVGPDVARRTTAREQRFLAGRAAARLRTRSCLGELLGADALTAWVVAAVRVVVPEYSPAVPPDEERVRRVARAIPRRARRTLEDAAHALAAAAAGPDLAAWRAAATATANRAGLVLCGDVPAALDLLLRDDAGGGPAGPAASRAAAHPEVLALLAFAASEAHFILRQRLRVAIA